MFGIGEFRALWFAQILSLIGDQLAIVALTWLVYDRSHSPLLAALTYSISFLPWVIGGPLLSGLADRLPRRELMVVCDLIRAVVMLSMAILGLPLWVLCALLFLSELLASPFSAARGALMPEILADDRYVVGSAIANITHQLGLVLGLGLGGLIVTVVTPPTALGANAATFVASAAVLRFGVKPRSAVRTEATGVTSFFSDAQAGARLIFGRPDLRLLTGFAMLCVFSVTPEGLAAPYASELGGGSATVGLLLASMPAGNVLGFTVFSRWVSPPERLRLMGPLAIAMCTSLVLCAWRPGLAWSLVIFAGCGAASAYQLAANAAFVTAVPPQVRGQAFGLVQALMATGQGASVLIVGALTQLWGAVWVLTVTGIVGGVASTALTASWRRRGASECAV